MGYFDRAKNLAHWEKEMQGLRREKEERSANPDRSRRSSLDNRKVKTETNPFRERVTLAELEREEKGERRAAAQRMAPAEPQISRDPAQKSK